MIIHAEITGITLLLVIGLIMGIIALKRKMKSDGTFDSKIIPLIEERKKVNKAFHKKYPEYQNFKSEFYELTVKKRNLENETSDLNDYIIQITLYNDKIEAHFSNK